MHIIMYLPCGVNNSEEGSLIMLMIRTTGQHAYLSDVTTRKKKHHRHRYVMTANTPRINKKIKLLKFMITEKKECFPPA